MDRGGREAFEQQIPYISPLTDEEAGLFEVLAGADAVGGQRERRARENDHRQLVAQVLLDAAEEVANLAKLTRLGSWIEAMHVVERLHRPIRHRAAAGLKGE